MTKQEAIEWFKLMKEKFENTKYADALNMAIEALEADPSEDCISREWLLNAFGLSEKTWKYGGDHSGYDTLMLYEIQDVIEDAPSVVPKERIEE